MALRINDLFGVPKFTYPCLTYAVLKIHTANFLLIIATRHLIGISNLTYKNLNSLYYQTYLSQLLNICIIHWQLSFSKSCWFHLQSISWIWPFLAGFIATAPVQDPIISHLNYCDILLIALPTSTLFSINSLLFTTDQWYFLNKSHYITHLLVAFQSHSP